jgi:hypothetical protein
LHNFVSHPNGGAHLPAPGLHDHHLNKLTDECKKAVIQRSAEGAGQVQRVLCGYCLDTLFSRLG